MRLRPYQESAVARVRALWESGTRAVLLVAPTGAGKTVLGKELASRFGRVLWLAHRRELVDQTKARLGAGCTVATVQSLLAKELSGEFDLVVLDEAHHYVADEWMRVVLRYPNARCLGLTATPERADGTPLGDIFEDLVVAANYSELLRDGFLVHVCVLQPSERLGNDLAQDPLDAWIKYSGGAKSFVFCSRVEAAKTLAQQFRDHGVMAECIEAETPERERGEIMNRFRSGRTRVLTNVNVLTEGVDVPEAACVILARSFNHVGALLQAAGRVLRPSPEKEKAIVLDLVGATLRFGMPTDDRVYSLEGRPIASRDGGGFGGGPGIFSQEILGKDLRMISSLPVVIPEPVSVQPIDDSERKSEYLRLISLARAHRMMDGFAAVKYREKYGEEPRTEWVVA